MASRCKISTRGVGLNTKFGALEDYSRTFQFQMKWVRVKLTRFKGTKIVNISVICKYENMLKR